MSKEFKEIVRTTGVYNCMDCGKCTSVCPISLRDPSFSPRKKLAESDLQWLCLTCNMCTTRCPMGVEFIDFIRDIRDWAHDNGNEGTCTHGCTIRTWGEMMAAQEVKPDRLGWLTKGLKTSAEGEVAYFVGCLPLYSQFFTEFAPDAIEAARDTVRVFNWLGIEPVIMDDEVCCGHDFLWSGDFKTFKDLAERNAEALRKKGIKTIVTACAECYRTLKVDYSKHLEDWSFKILHTSEYFLEMLGENSLELKGKNGDRKVTYHDPCRLSKHMGLISAPRELLEKVEGLELEEMPYNGTRSVCCGTSLWMNCNWISKDMQVERLKEAAGTGSHTLLTACPKCMIHFRCAMDENGSDEDIQIEVKDISSILAEAIKKKK
jgi:Fe-S oxidoreductase